MHVARGGKRIGGRRIERLVGVLEHLRIERHLVLAGFRAAHARALVRAVGHQHRVAKARVQRQRGGNQMAHEGRAADHRGFGELRPDAEVLGEREPRHEDIGAGDREAIHVARREPGIGQRVLRRRCRDLHLAPAGRFAAAGKSHARDGDRAPHAGVNSTRPSVILAVTVMPILTWSGGMVATRLSMRGPSARSTRHTL